MASFPRYRKLDFKEFPKGLKINLRVSGGARKTGVNPPNIVCIDAFAQNELEKHLRLVGVPFDQRFFLSRSEEYTSGNKSTPSLLRDLISPEDLNESSPLAKAKTKYWALVYVHRIPENGPPMDPVLLSGLLSDSQEENERENDGDNDDGEPKNDCAGKDTSSLVIHALGGTPVNIPHYNKKKPNGLYPDNENVTRVFLTTFGYGHSITNTYAKSEHMSHVLGDFLPYLGLHRKPRLWTLTSTPLGPRKGEPSIASGTIVELLRGGDRKYDLHPDQPGVIKAMIYLARAEGEP